MEKIELNVLGQARSESAPDHFALILEEKQGGRRLPIIIGPFEAQSIAIAMEGVDTGRPMTHDLFKNTIEALSASLTEVLIDSIRDGIFHAKLICEQVTSGKVVEVDARTSDAIALAVRFGCPIYAFPSVMNEASIATEAPSAELPSTKGALKNYSTPQLEELLQKALEREDYESAAKIRDAMNSKEE
ncbi:MAG: bifunctional nuclease family protein [Phaeodactylibacter sp.]|nr:bifunctional nuclease family protein [Phaeodactylibacter sp.]MCB9048236.1 bifunctional nuclease family protein [Lewinellaceae bacterium]